MSARYSHKARLPVLTAAVFSALLATNEVVAEDLEDISTSESTQLSTATYGSVSVRNHDVHYEDLPWNHKLIPLQDFGRTVTPARLRFKRICSLT